MSGGGFPMAIGRSPQYRCCALPQQQGSFTASDRHVTLLSVDGRSRENAVTDLRKQAAQQGWTSWQLARRVHDKARTPTLLMAWRLAAGLTQAELAEAVRGLAADAGSPCSPSTPSCQQISRWENGHDRPGAFYQGLLAVWYRTDPARLGLIGTLGITEQFDRPAEPAAENEDDEDRDDVNRRKFLALAAAPVLFQLDQVRRRMDADLRHVVPPADADRWAQISDQHVLAYGTVPPGILLERLTPDLTELAELIGQYPQQRELTKLAARLSGLTGALHTDLGDGRAARDWLHTAGRLSAVCGDLTTEYWIAMAQAMTAMYPPDPARVVDIAGRAAARLGPHPCAASAQLTGLLARAYAEAGDAVMARATLAAAERTAASLTAQQADEFFFGFPSRAMLMYTSGVLTAIADPAAWDFQTEALASYPVSDPIDRPLILLDRASHLARTGEPDSAADLAICVIAGLAPTWRVPLLISRADAVGKLINASSAHVGRRYRQALRETVPG
jgi:transcriptional regulator with XRE-family HTH domain